MLRGKSWNDGWLTAYWGKPSDASRGESKDLVFGFPCGPDGHLLHGAFCHEKLASGKTLIEELKARGYDITTLQFSIKRLPRT